MMRATLAKCLILGTSSHDWMVEAAGWGSIPVSWPNNLPDVAIHSKVHLLAIDDGSLIYGV